MTRNKLFLILCCLAVSALPALVQAQSDIQEITDFASLEDAFNRDGGNVRLVALLSPSCAYCVKGYRYLRKILDDVSDDHLKMYVVWEPMLSGDSKALAYKMSKKENDSRMVYQAWDGKQLTGKLWQAKMDLSGVAWDVYFLYGPNAVWNDGPGDHVYWQHQGAGGKENWLNYENLLAKVKELLSQM